LAVVLFAYLTAVLPGNADRMLSLLGKTRIIHNPRHYGTIFLHGGKHIPPYLGQHLLVVPGCVRHQVMERLMHATTIVGSQAGSHWLDALALTRQ
jgi:hypothetical protein